jgi:hypothetical protein
MTDALANIQGIINSNQVGSYRYLRFNECNMEISEGGQATIMATVNSLMGADEVSITVYLQRFDGDWTTIKKWEKSSKGNYLTFLEKHKIQKGIGYRIQVFTYADKGAYSECMVSEYGKVF